jgi:hypothetical protein
MAAEIADGMAYLADRKFVHRYIIFNIGGTTLLVIPGEVGAAP